MFVVCVHVQVRKGCEGAFIAASLENARNTVQEPGALRFDVLQEQEDPSRFVLYEAYLDQAAAGEHKKTAHYAAWRDAVEPWMAAPRQGVKYGSLFPPSEEMWAAVR